MITVGQARNDDAILAAAARDRNDPAIIRAIQETGYTGYLGQEFIPKRTDKLASLKQAVGICSVG